ncbi:hypothetical protein FHS19_006344 [Paenibacillus rhizosphaerae]|uniref:Uncharacterized protein n=1 Tax=Paenibacillus rhizosphaerae TaxID=297318 RepID=A0A839TYS4_9BACL|nr:hypothetical protein [Paenibacillus rhizosphaerae]MBB3131621.1 hypothetical protein [Paenibacillus rhizosphaerae]
MKPVKSAKPGKRVKSRSKPAKPVRISGIIPSATPGVGGDGNTGTISTGKQLAFISAFLFLIAAAISLYLAWRDIHGGNAPEMLF